MNPIPILIAFASIITSAVSQELGRQHTTKHFKYLGDFYSNQTYLLQGEEPGQFAVKFPNGIIYADVIINREELTLMFRDPNNGKIAFVLPSDPEFKKLRAKTDLQWQEMVSGTLGESAWASATAPNESNTKNKMGQTLKWYFVGQGWVEDRTETTYVGKVILNQPLELESVPIITVTEERRTYEIDPSRKIFKTQTLNPMAEPIGEEKTHTMKDGDIAFAIVEQTK